MSNSTTNYPDGLFHTELIGATIVNFVGGALAAGSGIGGGSIYLSSYIILLALNVYTAVPLSKIAIFGTAIGCFWVNVRERHPKANRPIIDYDLCFMMEAGTLLGTVIGVIFNVIFPSIVIIILLVLILSFTVYKTFIKGLDTYKKETGNTLLTDLKKILNRNSLPPQAPPLEIIRPGPYKTASLSDPNSSLVHDGSGKERSDYSRHFSASEEHLAENSPLLSSPKENIFLASPLTQHAASIESSEFGQDIVLKGILERESRTPILLILSIVVVWAVTLGIVFIAGTEKTLIPKIQCGTAAYWLVLSVVIPWIAFASAVFGWRVHKTWKLKLQHDYFFQDGDIKWTLRNVIIIPIVSIFCGIASGFLGIGGGLVAGPIMLEFGVLPSVAAASAAFQILFTASSTSAQYIFIGRIQWEYGLWFFGIGLTSALVGQSIVSWAIKKYKKQYMVAFLIAIVVLLSAITLAWSNIQHFVDTGVTFKFNQLCQNHLTK